MSKLLTDSSTWETQVEAPASGDARTALSVENGLQDLANRTKFLKDLAASGGSGIVSIRSAASTAAMQALTGMVAGDLCRVGTRIYVFQTGTPIEALQEGAYGYQAGDASGWWVCFRMTGVELLEERAAIVTNIVAPPTVVFTPGTYMDITGDTDWHDLTDGATPMSLTMSSLNEDDVVDVEATLHGTSDGTALAMLRASITYGGTPYDVPGSGAYGGGSTDVQRLSCSGRYVCPAGGATLPVVKLQGRVHNAGATWTVLDTSVMLKVKVYRPGP
jgi:hypothetical protein